MGNPNPNIAELGKETQFPVNRPAKPHTKKHPNGYLVPKLKKFLRKKITYQDPETDKFIKGTVEDAIIWRLLLNGAQGDNTAIKEILERIDGKVSQKLEGEGFGGTKIVILERKDGSRREIFA